MSPLFASTITTKIVGTFIGEKAQLSTLTLTLLLNNIVVSHPISQIDYLTMLDCVHWSCSTASCQCDGRRHQQWYNIERISSYYRNAYAPRSVSHTFEALCPPATCCISNNYWYWHKLPQHGHNHLNRTTRNQDAAASIIITILSYCKHGLVLFVVIFSHLFLIDVVP